MDSVSGYAGARSGGKIVRPRRTAAVRTPYDRPSSRVQDPSQLNPSWISRLVYKPASVIASGAGKFVSSVVFSDSSSSSSEDHDSASDIDGDDEKNITDSTENETMDLVNAQQTTINRLSSKRVIEQLLMKGTFAREEGDRLIDIIKSRVIDHPSVPAADERTFRNNGLTSDVKVGEMSNKAVIEARTWLEEKKSASSSKYKATVDDAGSPVDVAKSYMRARLPWGSSAVNNSEFQSPSPARMKHPKEGTPFLYSTGNFSSSKLQRNSRSNQSWNIQDEIRKVRAKATEEMLKHVSPSSVASLEPKHSPYVLNVDDGGVQAVENDQSVVLPNSSEQNQTTEGVVGLDNTFNSIQGVKPSEDTNTTQSGTGVDNFNDQNDETIGVTTNAVLALGVTTHPTGNFCIPKDVFKTSRGADEIGAERPTYNSFPSSSPSSPVAVGGQPKPKPPDETEASQPIAETPGDDITAGNGSDGAVNDENNDSDSSVSHNSSNTREEDWLPGDHSLPNSNSASSSPVLPYTRRGRGRGRGRSRGGRGKGRAK